jgi:hypothetical protein
MSPWDMLWWEWFLLAAALFIIRKIIYSEHPAGYAIRFCLLAGILLSVLMGVIRLAKLV